MSSADLCLQRAHAYLVDARDAHVDTATRAEALDAARIALLDAHRARAAPADILPHFKALCAHAASERAYQLRAMLPAAVEDLVARDMLAFAKIATPFLNAALDDANVFVAARAVKALTRLFRKVVGFVVSVGVGDGEGRFPQGSLAVWRQMQQKALALVSSNDEGLRKACVKFAETVVLAFTFSGSAGSADHFTLDYLLRKGSECPLLDPRALEEEGIRCVKSIEQLVHNSLEGNVISAKPDGRESAPGLPPMSLMTAISVLSNLVRRRRKILDFTLPPFLKVIAAVISGSRRLPTAPKGVLQLTESQRHSIIHVLRFNLFALRPYPHTRSGRAGADIMQAASDLEALEREEEMQRKERASKLAAISARERAEKEAAAAEEKRRAATAAAAQMQSTSMKRGREPANHGPPWPRLPPQKAYAVAQAITQSKPLPEVVNFIISALLHHIPPAETVPGAMRSIQNSRTSVGRAAPEEPALKRTRKSRFGAKEPERPSNQPAPPVLKKKVAVVRKVAPVVVPVRLTSTTVEKLVTFCCRRILKKESQAIASGAGPLRIQLLARLLTRLSQQDQGMLAHQFCEEVCAYIAEDIDHNMDLAQAWLFKLASEASLVKIAHETSPSMPLLEAVVEKGIAKKPEEPGEKPEPIIADQEMKASLPVDRNMKVEAVPESTEAEVPPTSKDRKATGKIEHDVKQESQVEKDEHIANGDEKPAKKEVNESTNDTIGEEVEVDILDALHVDGSYDRIFNRLLELLAGKQPFVGDSFSQIICEAPVLPQSVFESLKNFCNDPSKIKVGLHALRDIVLKRPGEDRTKCLSLLLSFTTNDDEVLRGPSIRLVANHLFAECVGEVPQMIERHAVKSLNAAIQSLSENSTPDELDSLERACLLLTALCGQKHTLLREIAKSYVSMTPAGRHILLQRAKSLAGELGMSSIPIVQLIAAKLLPMKPRKDGDTFETDGLEILALEVLRALLKKFGKPTEELVEAACTRHDITGNTAFIIAVLPGLRKESLLKHLAAIVNSVHNPRSVEEKGSSEEKSGPTGETSKTAGFKEIINIVMSSRPPPISASEMLFELHCIEPNSAVHTALLACFELKSVYKQEVIAQAIQQLIEKTVIPDLLMRTVLLARIHCPEMEKYLTGTVLKRLIDKQVWKNSILWEGFLFYCASVKEKSLKVLLSLPAPQLKEALDKEEDLLVTFKGLFANPKNLKKAPSVKHRKVIQAAIQKPAKDS